MPDELDNRWDERDEDDAENDDGEMLFHRRQIAEEVATEDKDRRPEKIATDTIGQKTRIGHATDTRDKWRKGTNDRHKSGNDNGFAAVLFVELVGFLQVFFLDKPGLLSLQDLVADQFADVIVGVVSDNRCAENQDEDELDVQRSSACEGSRSKQQRIARQDRCHHQTSLTKNHQKQQRVGVCAISLDNRT